MGDTVPANRRVCEALEMGEKMTVADSWEPQFVSSGRGTWYVDNVRYPSGAVGCVGKGFGGGWVVACQPELGSFGSRLQAARAERDHVRGLVG